MEVEVEVEVEANHWPWQGKHRTLYKNIGQPPARFGRTRKAPHHFQQIRCAYGSERRPFVPLSFRRNVLGLSEKFEGLFNVSSHGSPEVTHRVPDHIFHKHLFP